MLPPQRKMGLNAASLLPSLDFLSSTEKLATIPSSTTKSTGPMADNRPTTTTTAFSLDTQSLLPPDLFKTNGDAPAFDVDPATGFMAHQPPLARLPPVWEAWEAALDDAVTLKLQVGDRVGITEGEKACSEAWRSRLREIPPLSTAELNSPPLLRRAHLVLAFLQHFYIQSLPPDVTPIIIPRSIALPMLRISKILDIPPLLTFSDTVLYNWHIDPDRHHQPQNRQADGVLQPSPENVRTQTMFTNSVDEEEFYLCSARIELCGVEALELMRMTMDEMFIGDDIAVQRITTFLQRMVIVIDQLRLLLLDVKIRCRPDTYYNQVRPWFRGQDSDLSKRPWIFEGVEEDPELQHQPRELSGPSAGQSSMVHVLDIFLGVDHQASATPNQPSFMSRMQTYMPKKHRLFLNHLAANPRPLRRFVMGGKDEWLMKAYNEAVMALKRFRDSHMIIATLFIIGPARRAARMAASAKGGVVEEKEDGGVATGVTEGEPLKGTGGTDLVKFLKDTRTRTAEAVIQQPL